MINTRLVAAGFVGASLLALTGCENWAWGPGMRTTDRTGTTTMVTTDRVPSTTTVTTYSTHSDMTTGGRFINDPAQQGGRFDTPPGSARPLRNLNVFAK